MAGDGIRATGRKDNWEKETGRAHAKAQYNSHTSSETGRGDKILPKMGCQPIRISGRKQASTSSHAAIDRNEPILKFAVIGQRTDDSGH